MQPEYKMRRAMIRRDMEKEARKKPKISLRQIFDKKVCNCKKKKK